MTMEGSLGFRFRLQDTSPSQQRLRTNKTYRCTGLICQDCECSGNFDVNKITKSITQGLRPKLFGNCFTSSLEVDALLLFSRRHCPRRSAAPVAASDGEAVQDISGEYVDHVTGEDEPHSANDRFFCQRLFVAFGTRELGREGLRGTLFATHFGIIHRKIKDKGSLCLILSKPEKYSLQPVA